MTPLTYEFKNSLLKVENVSVTLGNTPVLKNLNMEIRDVVRPGVTQGQVVGLLGPSGVGKTTLFRILAGLSQPDTGRVLVEEEGHPVQRGMVGVVAQDYPLFPHRTVLSNLTVAGRSAGFGSKEATDKALSYLTRFGLEEHARKYPVQLSGGQKQRVAIAQQFMCSDHFLLMDEPFSGLDLVAIKRVCAFIKEMSCIDEFKTFIIVTHDIAALLEVADTVFLLGRDYDAGGKPIPGARIMETYDLMARGLAWRENVADTPDYLMLLREIRERFQTL